MRCTCIRTSKDLKFLSFLLPSFCLETKSWQKPISWQTSQYQYKQRIPLKSFLPKILPKNSSQKIRQKKYLQKSPPDKFPRNSKKFKKISKKFLRFWKYPNPYIALGGRKPFRACFFQILKSCLWGPAHWLYWKHQKTTLD